MSRRGDRAALAPLPAALLARCVQARSRTLRTDLRSGAYADVQIVAGAGPYELDVLVRVLAPDRFAIVGQVTRAERVCEPVSRLGLVLYDADAMRAVAHTETDPFGEFAFEELGPHRHVLALGTSRDAPCVLIWEGGRRVADCPTAV